MRALSTVSCSLNLGLIYNIDYSYSPENGVAITIFFVNESGEYSTPNLLPMTKANVSIGGASFSVYPKSYKLSKAAGRRVISVEFIDEIFMLNNYYVVLTNRGCGEGIYPLGQPVDKRTDAQKITDALDPDAQVTKNFAQFEDVEYGFRDFLNVLQTVFPVLFTSAIDELVTRDTIGTFREVLDDWCSFLGLAYFFENGYLNIYNPTNLTINLPSKPSDAISYEISEDIENTFSKTICSYFEKEGGEIEYNADLEDIVAPGATDTSTSPKANDITSHFTLYPAGYAISPVQTSMDLKQVAAAMFGKEFWLLYNYNNATMPICGWNFGNFAVNAGVLPAEVDDIVFQETFKAYSEYGTFAGRWYLSDEIIGGLEILETNSWYSEVEGPVYRVDSYLANERAISLSFISPPNSANQFIPETVVNKYFPGIVTKGKRMSFFDAKDNGQIAAFSVSDSMRLEINASYASFRPDGSNSLNLSGLGTPGKNYIGYYAPKISDALLVIMTSITKGEYDQYLKPRYASYPVKGVKRDDVINRKRIKSMPKLTESVGSGGAATGFESPTPITTADVPSVVKGKAPVAVQNSSSLRAKKNGSRVAYYDKINLCKSFSSSGKYFKRIFDIHKISDDNQLKYTFNQGAGNYSITRDYAEISAIMNNPTLQLSATSRTFAAKTVSFTVNYFYQVPFSFLSSGLVSVQMSVTDSGVTCSYTFSNRILNVPISGNEIQKIQNSLKYSSSRQYTPTSVVQLK